jgi:hypothetical protein
MTKLKFQTNRLIIISVQMLEVLLHHLAHETDTTNVKEFKVLKECNIT